MKIALIVNPFSGGKNRANREKQVVFVKKELDSRQIEYDIYLSRFNRHIYNIGFRIDPDSYDAIIAMGGDGTNFYLLNGLLAGRYPHKLPPLGIIPVGSGNSFAKELNLNNIRDGIKAIFEYRSKPVDVCSFSQKDKIFYFVNLTGLGFVTDVASTAEHFKMFHDFSYVIGVLYRTLSLDCFDMELEIEGRLYSGKTCFVEFCNSRYTGGNMCMAPNARIDDGLMDIVIAAPLSRTRLVAALPKIYKGTHIDLPEVTCIQARKAQIRTSPVKTLLPDGELFGATPTRVEVHHKMVRYLTWEK